DFMDFLADDVSTFRRPAPPPSPTKKEPWRHHFEMLRTLKVHVSPTLSHPPRKLTYLIDGQVSNASRLLGIRVGLSRRKKKGEWSPANFNEHSIRDVDE